MKIQHKCDNYSNLCDNNVTCKLNCLPESIQLWAASLLHRCASSISRVCRDALGDFSKSDSANLPMAVCGEAAFLEDLPRRNLAAKRPFVSPQRARKSENKVVFAQSYLALRGWPSCSINFGTARFHSLLPYVGLVGKSQEGLSSLCVVHNPRTLHVMLYLVCLPVPQILTLGQLQWR